jgi:hypothetical protein
VSSLWLDESAHSADATTDSGLADFPFLSTRNGVKLPESYEETGFATSRAATPEITALFQGFDAVEAFQSAHVFP